jgi:hypothetical protein
MRVWLVDEKSGAVGGNLEAMLRQLEERPGTGLRLLGATPFQADFTQAMRKLVPDLLDLLLINERAWPEGAWTQELLNMGLGMLVQCPPERLERFRALAELHPIGFIAPGTGLEGLWLGLWSVWGAKRREAQWRSQVARLEQRLSDRIVIERAKGILIQRLKITEEEAYKRLHMLSRRQRRQIRDIAQSLLDTQLLLSSEENGLAPLLPEEGGTSAENSNLQPGSEGNSNPEPRKPRQG